MVGSPDRKGQEGVERGCCPSRVAILCPNSPPPRGPGKPAGKGCVPPWAVSSGFPSTSGLQLPSFLGPSPPMAPAPRLTAPRPSTPTTHAEGQQKNVEQELDTLHSSFHRHGCWAWGRGEHRDRIRPRGHRLGSSPPALAAFPARSPPRPFPPGNPRSDPRLPVPSARRPHRGGGAQRAGPRDPGTHGGRGRAPCRPRSPPAAAQRQSLRSAGCDPGAAGASPSGRPVGVANFEAKLLEGPGKQPAALGRPPASPALPDAARCSPAAGQPPSPRLRPPSAPRPPRGPAPAPASPLPRGVAASLPHVTREQLRPESPGRAAEGEASPPPGQGHVAPTRRARAGRRPIPATPKDGGAAQSCPEAETRPSVKMAFGRLQPPPRVTRATHLPLRPGSSPRPHSRARGERCIGWGEGKHFQKAPGFTSQQPPSIPD